MWHINVKWQSDEIGAFSSAMLCFSSDKNIPERTYLLSNHIQSILRVKDKHLNQGKAEDGTGTHSFSLSTSVASYVHYNYRMPLPGSLASFTVQGERCCLNPQLFNIYLQSSACGFAGCTTQHWDPASPASCSTRGSREPAAPFARFALAHAGCWRRWRGRMSSSLFKDFAFWNTIQWEEERHLFWEGRFAGFVWSVFVLTDMSEKGEGLSCPESIHVKQSATGISQQLPTFTHFSKSKTALSLTSVWFQLG